MLPPSHYKATSCEPITLDVLFPHESSWELCHWFCCLLSNLTKNRSLCQINFKCLLKFANDALQHLWVLQIHKVIIIDSKKAPTYRNPTMRPPTITCASMVSSCRTFEFSQLEGAQCFQPLKWRCNRGVWMWGTNAFLSTPSTLSIMQNSTSSTIKQTNKMHNAPTHNKQRHTKTKQTQPSSPKTKTIKIKGLGFKNLLSLWNVMASYYCVLNPKSKMWLLLHVASKT